MTTRLRALALLAAATASVVVGVAPWADAFEQEGMTIAKGQTVEATYGPIPGNNAAFTHYPDECATSTYCDVVPLDVIVPEDLKPGDDFIIRVTMSWPEQAADTPGYRGSSNDLDMYIYDDKQTETAEPPEDGSEPDYTEKTSGASDQNPEVAQLFRPTLGRYNIVVNNFLGTNVEYTIKLEWESFEVDPAVELLAPPPDGPRRTTTTSTTRPTTTTTGAATEPAVSIPEGVVLPDDDFDSSAFGGEASVDEQLATLEEISNNADGLAGRRFESPSALTLLLWMVVVPAALVGMIVLVLRRTRGRRRARPAT